jgi:DNA-binding transcriptional MerR regulator
MDDQLTVAEIAQRAGIAPSHVRYYERAGLLPAPARAGRQVRYPAGVMERLHAIALARDAGLTLEEIRELSALRCLVGERSGQRRADQRGDRPDGARADERRHDAEAEREQRDGGDGEQRDLPGLLQRAGQRDR